MAQNKVRPIVAALAPVLAGLTLAVNAYATNSEGNSATVQTSSESERHSAQSMRDIQASRLIGTDVYDVSGEKLGEIEDLVIDLTTEEVHYAVLAHGGFIGIGERLFAYPMSAFKTSADKQRLTLDVPREKLEDAKGFARNNWPDWADPSFRDSMRQYSGEVNRIVQPDENQTYARASELIGADVQGHEQESIGEIEDVIVRLGNGKIHYMLVELDEGIGEEGKLAVLSPKSLHPVPGSDDMRIDANREQLARVPSVNEDELWRLNETAWVTDIDRYLVTITPLPSAQDNRQARSTAAQQGATGSTGSKQGDSSVWNADMEPSEQSGAQQGVQSGSTGSSGGKQGDSSVWNADMEPSERSGAQQGAQSGSTGSTGNSVQSESSVWNADMEPGEKSGGTGSRGGTGQADSSVWNADMEPKE